ncbi:MAG: glycosyltransferase [Fibrobacteres bacterium]|nr:glycosyltransferase [Fibrobacterota bacterium]
MEFLVDVNIVTYNHEKFIRQTIESVLQQKTTFNVRIVIGDDGSTDKTQEIIKEYERQYPEKFKCILYTKNVGINSPDRVGLKVLESSTSKYINLLDGDDYWTDENKLQMQVDFLELNPDFSMCFHNAEVIYENSNRKSHQLCNNNMPAISTLKDVLRGFNIPTASALFRNNNLYGRLPKWFGEVLGGDIVIWSLNAMEGNVYYINRVMSRYRIHSGGLTQNIEKNNWERIKLYKHMLEYFPKQYSAILKTNIALNYVGVAQVGFGNGQYIKLLYLFVALYISPISIVYGMKNLIKSKLRKVFKGSQNGLQIGEITHGK